MKKRAYRVKRHDRKVAVQVRKGCKGWDGDDPQIDRNLDELLLRNVQQQLGMATNPRRSRHQEIDIAIIAAMIWFRANRHG